MREMTLAGFIGHIAGSIVSLNALEHAAMERACRIVEAEAKREIGHYQSAAGPFAGWAELADSTKEQRVKLGYTENDPGLRSGEMQASIGHVAEQREGVIGSDDQNLVYFELGTTRQPPRSVLGIAAVHKERQVVEILGSSVVKALVGEEVVDKYLSIPRSAE
jgi:hypothetical protein